MSGELHCLEITPEQTRRFSEHVAGCKTCRAVVIAGWSTSIDVTEALDDLCLAGASIVSVPLANVASA